MHDVCRIHCKLPRLPVRIFGSCREQYNKRSAISSRMWDGIRGNSSAFWFSIILRTKANVKPAK